MFGSEQMTEKSSIEIAHTHSLEEIRELSTRLHEAEVQKIYEHILELRKSYAESVGDLRKAFENVGLTLEEGLGMRSAQFLKHLSEMVASRKDQAAKVVNGVVPKKFQHPTNPALTWSGRGVYPVWLREYLRDNPEAKLEDLRIRAS